MVLPIQFFSTNLLSEVLLNTSPWLQNNARLSGEGDVLIAVTNGVVHFTENKEVAVFRAASLREASLAMAAIVAIHRSHGIALQVEYYY